MVNGFRAFELKKVLQTCSFQDCSDQALYTAGLTINYPPNIRKGILEIELENIEVCDQCAYRKPVKAFLSLESWQILKGILKANKEPSAKYGWISVRIATPSGLLVRVIR